MITSLVCLTNELEFVLSYTILILITIASLYNITQGIELEFSKLLLTTAIGVAIPSPRLKNKNESNSSDSAEQ